MKEGPKNSGRGLPPPWFGQCPKVNILFYRKSSLIRSNMQQRHIWISWLWRVHAEGGMIIRWEMVNCKCCGSCLVTPLLPSPTSQIGSATSDILFTETYLLFVRWFWWPSHKNSILYIGWSVEKQKWLTFASLSNQRRKVWAQPTQTLQCDVIWRNADITHSYCRLLLPLSSQIYLLCSVTGILVNATPAHVYLSPAQHKIYACCRACGLHTPFTSVSNPK